eukprot:7730-Heterococcus_DN1.PRE.4
MLILSLYCCCIALLHSQSTPQAGNAFDLVQEGLSYFNEGDFKEAHKAELSHLAHVAVKTDQFRPETCCILGNYCSVKGELCTMQLVACAASYHFCTAHTSSHCTKAIILLSQTSAV